MSMNLSAYTFLAVSFTKMVEKVSESEYHSMLNQVKKTTFPVEFRCWSFKC